MENLKEDINTEEQFHDNWADSTDVSKIDVYKTNEAVTSPELRFISSIIGNVKGKKFLDLGSGLGEVGVYYATKGADVTCADISDKMLNISQQLASKNNVNIKTVKVSIENLELDERYDIIYAGNVLHHIEIEKVIPKLKNTLKEKGILVIWDPLAYNPIINIYRKIAIQVRTTYEHPLKKKDVDYIKSHFNVINTDFFWFTTLLIFIIMFIFQFKNPNKVRYWKIIIEEADKWRFLYCPLEKLDKILLRVFPFLKYLCWNIVIIAI